MFDKADLQSIYLAKKLAQMEESGELQDFVDFARDELKEQGIKSEALDEFFDWLEEQGKESEDDINWFKVGDIISKTTGCRYMIFKGDKTVAIENEELDDDDIYQMVVEDDAKLNLNKINIALEPIGVKLEFIEAVNLPLRIEIKNFCRFKVVKL